MSKFDDFRDEFQKVCDLHLSQFEHAEARLERYTMDDPFLYQVRKVGKDQGWSDHRIAVVSACVMAAKAKMLSDMLTVASQFTTPTVLIPAATPPRGDERT